VQIVGFIICISRTIARCRNENSRYYILCLLDRASLWLLKNKRPTWWHLLFYFTSYVLNMFRTLINPSSGACDYSVELPHWSYVFGLMCVGVSVKLCFSLQHRYHSNPTTPKLQHTSNQEHTTNVVIQQNSRKLLIMDILMSETWWAHKKWNKITSDIKLIFYSSAITMKHSFSLQHRYHSNPTTPTLQHTSNQEHTTNVVIQQNSHKLLMMDILMSETCSAHKKWNKITSDIKLIFYSSAITMKLCFSLQHRYHLQPNHTETPTHIKPRTYDQCGNSTE